MFFIAPQREKNSVRIILAAEGGQIFLRKFMTSENL